MAYEKLEALYAWLLKNNEGKGSDKYWKMIQLQHMFKPGALWSLKRTILSNRFYDDINEGNFEEKFNEVMRDT